MFDKEGELRLHSRKSPTCAIKQSKFLTSPQRLTDEVTNFGCFGHKSETCAGRG